MRTLKSASVALSCALSLHCRSWLLTATSQAMPRTAEPQAKGWSTGWWKPSATASRARRLMRESSYRSLRYAQSLSIHLAVFRSSSCQWPCLFEIQLGQRGRTDTLVLHTGEASVLVHSFLHVISVHNIWEWQMDGHTERATSCSSGFVSVECMLLINKNLTQC